MRVDTINARWPGVCCACGRSYPAGTPIQWEHPDRKAGEQGRSRACHVECKLPGTPMPAPKPTPETPAPQPMPESPPTPPLPGEGPFENEQPEPRKVGDSLGDTIADEVWKRIEPRIQRAIPEPPPDGKPLRRRITIVKTGDAPEVEVEDTHPLFPKLLQYINRGVNCYLYGAAGSGKSHTAMQVAAALNRPFYYLGFTPATMPSALFGHTLATSHEVVRTPFREAWENGGIFLADEPANTREDMIMSLNGCISAKKAAFPDKMVDMHPDFVLLAADNTNGMGGDVKYPTRRKLDEAFRSRFIFLEWTYDEQLERAVARKFAMPDTKPEAIDAWVSWVREVRSFCDTRFPTVVITPRASYTGARLLDIDPVSTIADATVFSGLDATQKREALAACPLPNIVLE